MSKANKIVTIDYNFMFNVREIDEVTKLYLNDASLTEMQRELKRPIIEILCLINDLIANKDITTKRYLTLVSIKQTREYNL